MILADDTLLTGFSGFVILVIVILIVILIVIHFARK